MNANLLADLSSLPKQCVYGLINEQDSRIFIGHTPNIVTALGRIINEYSNNLLKKDWDKLKLIIIETIDKPESLRLRCSYWMKEYSNKGYALYRVLTNVPTYKLRIDLMDDFRGGPRGSYLFYVKLVSRGYRELIVGVFNKDSDYHEFVNKFYPVGYEVNNIVYADNDLTKEYHGSN